MATVVDCQLSRRPRSLRLIVLLSSYATWRNIILTPLTFEMKTATLVNPALGCVYTNFGVPVPPCFFSDRTGREQMQYYPSESAEYETRCNAPTLGRTDMLAPCRTKSRSSVRTSVGPSACILRRNNFVPATNWRACGVRRKIPTTWAYLRVFS